jgi:exonuclease SbcD
LSIGGADRVSYQPLQDFDYVALGHLHAPQYKGKEHIRYSGSLLKYSFSEVKQKKGITLVELDNKGLVST